MQSQLLTGIRSRLIALRADESGQDLAEYAVLIGLVALAVVSAVLLLGETISSVFNDIGTTLEP
jgi:Flp pilus assembly pilin Flp